MVIEKWPVIRENRGVTMKEQGTAPGDTLQVVTPEWNNFVAKFRQNTDHHEQNRRAICLIFWNYSLFY